MRPNRFKYPVWSLQWWVAAVAQAQLPAWEPPHVAGMAPKNGRKKIFITLRSYMFYQDVG